MRHRIIKMDSFPVIGIELRTTTEDGRNFREIPQFWEKFFKEGHLGRIPDRRSDDVLLGICMDESDDNSFSYIIGSEVTNTTNVPDGMVCRTIPAAEYAVFTARGKMPVSIQDTIRYIYRDWLPGSQYRHAGTAEFEWYDERCNGEEDAEVDIYIPIAKQ